MIERIAREVWNANELSLQERKSCEIHVRELRDAGFTIVSQHTSGLPTAFVAEWSQDGTGPKIGFLPEYDALPALANAPVPRPEPRSDGNTVGHGCGHNLLGAACTGAAVATKRIMERRNTPGTVRVYGCAAEESEGAKVYMARDGLFDDLDACFAWHPAPVAAAGGVQTAAVNTSKIEFFGKSAHAGNAPWEGRSAVHAAELFAHGLNLMREHVEPTSRIMYIYESAGTAVNVVPDYARVMLTIRDRNRARVEATTKWAGELANGAAIGTQTRAAFAQFFGLTDLLPNMPLAKRTHEHMTAVGLADWTTEEQIFARACQKAMGLSETGLATALLPLLPDMTVGGGTDVGDVSWNAPTIVFAWPTMPQGVGLHTWAVTACGGMSIGEKGAVAAARVMTATAYDVLMDPGLRAAARQELETRKQGRSYTSPLQKEQLHPYGLPESTIKSGGDEILAGVDTGAA